MIHERDLERGARQIVEPRRMTHARRVDGNQRSIVAALRKVGWKVMDLSRAGDGCPDLLAYHTATGELRLVEVKAPKGTPTPAQQRLLDEGWPIVTCRTIEQAIGLLER